MVISLGEALIDLIYRDTDGTPSFVPAPGGSPFNTSIALNRLGVPAAYLGKLSSDLFGTMLLEHLEKNQVEIRTVIRSDKPTTLAFAKIDSGKAEYAFYTNGSADRSITGKEIDTALHRLSSRPECLQIGSISLALEPGAEEIHKYVMERDREILASFDPNVRPSMIGNRDAYLVRLEELFSSVDIVKISDEDLSWIYPELTLSQGAYKILRQGASVCVVTEGSSGSWWFSEHTEAWASTHPVEVKDTIGAGDTFHAGLLAYLHREGFLSRRKLAEITKADAERALRFATHAAEGTCRRRGADPPMIDEVLELMKQEDAAHETARD